MLRELATPELTRVTYYRAGQRRLASLLRPTSRRRWHAGPDLLHLSGITAALSDSGAATVQAAVAKHAPPVFAVSFDVNHRPHAARCAGFGRTRPAACSARSTCCSSATMNLGSSPTKRSGRGLSDLLDRGPSEVVVKRGPNRPWPRPSDGERAEQPAWPITVVDLVGAGDSFVAGYLAARLEDRPYPNGSLGHGLRRGRDRYRR